MLKQWFAVPQDTFTLALTCQDPDAPRGTFTDLRAELDGAVVARDKLVGTYQR